MTELGEEVYVCHLFHPPGTVSRHGNLEIMGTVDDEEDAEMWADSSENHEYTTTTLGLVEDY